MPEDQVAGTRGIDEDQERQRVAAAEVWHRRFLLLEDAMARTGHSATRADHHAKVCPLCTSLRAARGVGGVGSGAGAAGEGSRETDH